MTKIPKKSTYRILVTQKTCEQCLLNRKDIYLSIYLKDIHICSLYIKFIYLCFSFLRLSNITHMQNTHNKKRVVVLYFSKHNMIIISIIYIWPNVCLSVHLSFCRFLVSRKTYLFSMFMRLVGKWLTTHVRSTKILWFFEH